MCKIARPFDQGYKVTKKWLIIKVSCDSRFGRDNAYNSLDLLMDSLDYMPNAHNLLARKGTTFNKHYCTSALCCPSRTNLLTGKCVQ